MRILAMASASSILWLLHSWVPLTWLVLALHALSPRVMQLHEHMAFCADIVTAKQHRNKPSEFHLQRETLAGLHICENPSDHMSLPLCTPPL